VHIGLLGEGSSIAARALVLRRTPGVTVEHFARLPDPHSAPGYATFDALLTRTDALVLGGSPGARFALVELALKRATPLLLEWPPVVALAECEAAVRLSEEAGVEIGVSRILRQCPDLAALPKRPRIVSLRLPLEAPPAPWRHVLADAVDLCVWLARSVNVRRMDVQAVRSQQGPWFEALACSLRFHNGTLAQVMLARDGDPPPTAPTSALPDITLAGPGYQRRIVLPARAALAPETWRARETLAFHESLRDRTPPPVPLRDGLHVMRLVERIVQQVR
jgi:predicted dehydrogenase